MLSSTHIPSPPVSEKITSSELVMFDSVTVVGDAQVPEQLTVTGGLGAVE